VAYNSTDYSGLLLDHYENPRNAGDLPDPDGVATVENPACGDRLKLSLRIGEGRIREARFRAFGCPAAIAASSVTTEMITGRSLSEAGRLSNVEVATALGGLPPAKIHCSVLAEEAVRAAIEDYRHRPRPGDRRRGRNASGATRE
jgi:nitrogen fixation NifU-like protein